MICPICAKRKAKRFCPAKAADICSVCCGTEREVTLDCPSDCLYLVASRQHDRERREVDRSTLPFAGTTIPSSFVADHENLILGFSHAICAYAKACPAVVDSDVILALSALAETYKTLSSGIYYENPPDYLLQRELYDGLRSTVEDFRRAEAQVGLASLRDSEIRDALIFLVQLGAMETNGRPKGRAYLDFVRVQFGIEESSGPASLPASRIVLP